MNIVTRSLWYLIYSEKMQKKNKNEETNAGNAIGSKMMGGGQSIPPDDPFPPTPSSLFLLAPLCNDLRSPGLNLRQTNA